GPLGWIGALGMDSSRTKRPVSLHSWSAHGGWLSWDADWTRACGGIGTMVALWHPYIYRLLRALASDRRRGGIERFIGSARELVYRRGFCRALSSISRGAFCHHGRERGRLVRRKHSLAHTFTDFQTRTVVGRFSRLNDRR